VGSSVFGDLEFALPVSKTQKDLGNFKIWFSGHGFQDLGSQHWGLDFHTCGFQDRNLKTFRMWFSGCGISILGPGFHIGGFTWSKTLNFFGTWFSGHGWGTKQLHNVRRSRAPTSYYIKATVVFVCLSVCGDKQGRAGWPGQTPAHCTCWRPATTVWVVFLQCKRFLLALLSRLCLFSLSRSCAFSLSLLPRS